MRPYAGTLLLAVPAPTLAQNTAEKLLVGDTKVTITAGYRSKGLQKHHVREEVRCPTSSGVVQHVELPGIRRWNTTAKFSPTGAQTNATLINSTVIIGRVCCSLPDASTPNPERVPQQCRARSGSGIVFLKTGSLEAPRRHLLFQNVRQT